ncbi:MAG: class I SAM-dependent methyltransferase [Bradymonadaceae bacterium]|nr:class I SAM-dependent methyltransferase [Lujinxingiaceae bacterium]
MSTRTLPLEDHLYDYVKSVSLREPPIFELCRLETARLPMGQMQISPEQGQFLAFLVELIGAKTAIEIGTFTGYSSLWIASALPDRGCLLCCDISEPWTAVARRYWEEARLMHKIELHVEPALQMLDGLVGHADASFDFAFIDADKQNYDAYYEGILRLIRPGGLIAIDNVLWSGKVADWTVSDPDTEAIRQLNNKLHDDDRVSLTLVPIGDGMTLLRKR